MTASFLEDYCSWCFLCAGHYYPPTLTSFYFSSFCSVLLGVSVGHISLDLLKKTVDRHNHFTITITKQIIFTIITVLTTTTVQQQSFQKVKSLLLSLLSFCSTKPTSTRHKVVYQLMTRGRIV